MVPDRMLSLSPLSLPTTRTSRPTAAASGASGMCTHVMNCSLLGSKAKKPKSCTGSRYTARTGISSRFRKTASATTGPGLTTEHSTSQRVSV